MASFFLPTVRGCNDQIVYPYQEVFDGGPDWIVLFMFLYPIVLAALVWFIHKALKPSWRSRFMWLLLYAIGLGLSYLAAELIKDPNWRELGVWGSALMILWGVVFLGLARIKTVEGLTDLLHFTVTAFALWLFPIGLFSSVEILIGGWIFIYANSIILVTYVLPFLVNAFQPKPPGKPST